MSQAQQIGTSQARTDPRFQAFENLDQAFGNSFAQGQPSRVVDDESARQRWELHKANPIRRAAFVYQLGQREGITGPQGLQRLDERYQADMIRRFG